MNIGVNKKKLAAALLVSAAGVFGVSEGQAAENEEQCVQDLTDPELKWHIYRAQRSETYNYVPFRLIEVFNEETQENELVAEPTGCVYISRDEYYTTPQNADHENVEVSANYDMAEPNRAARFNSLVATMAHFQERKIPGPPRGDSPEAQAAQELWTDHCETTEPAYNGITGAMCPYRLAYRKNGTLHIQ